MYFSWIFLISGWCACSDRIERICFSDRGRIASRVTIVSRMIETPQLDADVVVKEGEDRVGDVDQRLEDVWMPATGSIRPGLGGPAASSRVKERARLDGVVAAVAERVAARQAPGGQDRAADDAQLANRLHGVGRAGGLVLAAARERRRDQALVEADRGEDDGEQPRVSRFTLQVRRFRPPARPLRPAPASAVATPAGPSRSTRPATSGRATSTKSWPRGSVSSSDQNASLSARFTAFLSTAPPTLRLTETPSRTSSSIVVGLAAGERVEDQEAVGVGAALAVDAVEVAAARQAAAPAPLAR